MASTTTSDTSDPGADNGNNSDENYDHHGDDGNYNGDYNDDHYDNNDIDSDYSDEPSSSTTPSESPSPSFPLFSSLPPELRHQIWRFAVPSPGINFFNLHCFPNDHDWCDRSNSPPWTYLDLRRLDIEHDDEEVARYDPSTWQARNAVRQACHEARVVCAIPAAQAATITLTRPKRGLFVRASDGQLRLNTPYFVEPSQEDSQHQNQSGSNSTLYPWRPRPSHPVISGDRLTEPVLRRTIQVHVQEMLVLSVENCSFNMPFEENAMTDPDAAAADDDDDGDPGWSYDPELTPKLPLSIFPAQICINMVRCSVSQFRKLSEPIIGLMYGHIPEDLYLNEDGDLTESLNIMCDDMALDPGDRDLGELTPLPMVFRDRFGDCYVRLQWDPRPEWLDDSCELYRLMKVWPETNDVRKRYIRSAILSSPKRPARPLQ
ncbi:hypothetical protein F5Y17DRAFT_272607 [Xylariaceae sp. FL0594]|nr:hypothetical protein F5Y17DRAFT_272607 [Xylariaceae sp. FL0594]